MVDSPIAAEARASDRPEGRILSREELDSVLRCAGLEPAWYRVHRGLLWWRHQLKAWLLGQPPFDFPIVVGRHGTGPR